MVQQTEYASADGARHRSGVPSELLIRRPTLLRLLKDRTALNNYHRSEPELFGSDRNDTVETGPENGCTYRRRT